MRIGLINILHGRPERDPPTWATLAEGVQTAEAVGFDSFVVEDALLFKGDEGSQGFWESVSMVAALSAMTSQIAVGHSVINSPYRSPAMLASIVTTLDEISDGRYVFGIGAGNTPDSDYAAFGFPTDHRFSRFAEAIEIIHSLLKEGRADFNGKYYRAKEAEIVLRGPRPQGPPINIAAGGPRMLRLVARYADAWNWWAWDESFDDLSKRFAPILESMEQALEEEGRDPKTLRRTIDFYSIVPPGLPAQIEGRSPLTGSPSEIAETLLRLTGLGFDEVRCDLLPHSVAAIEAMAPVVELVQGG